MWLYLITEPDEVPTKIGVAECPLSRVRQLQIGNPKRLMLWGAIKVSARRTIFDMEDAAHRKFHGRRLSGEWFEILASEAAEFFCRNFLLLEGAEAGDGYKKAKLWTHVGQGHTDAADRKSRGPNGSFDRGKYQREYMRDVLHAKKVGMTVRQWRLLREDA